MHIVVDHWGLIPYPAAYDRQRVCFEAALRAKAARVPVENRLIFCEHPHVITLGRNGLRSNLLFPDSVLKSKQVAVYSADRGGDVTYHGPGQAVAYPIFDLEAFHLGLKNYIDRLEQVIINTLSEYGLRGERLPGATGVWIDGARPDRARKMAAIGVRSSRYVTMHGLALNVNTDLSYFQLINPCGFKDRGVTSLQRELGRALPMEDVWRALERHFERLFPAE